MSEFSLKSDFPEISQTQWRAFVEKGLRGSNYETLTRETDDGMSRGPLLLAENLPEALVSLARTDLPLLEILDDLTGGASAIRIEANLKISSRNDLKRLLEGVYIGLIPIHVASSTGNAQIYEVARGHEPLQSTIFWAGLHPIEDSEVLRSSLKTAPTNWRLMGLSPADIHEAGGTDTHELAVLAASLSEAMRNHGPEKVCKHMVIDLAADRDTHLTIAKFRSARRIIRCIAEAFGGDGSTIPLCAITSLRMMQSEDAWTNLLRVMSAGFGAVIGGADMVTTRPFTDGLGHATPFAHRIARNMQLMMMEESHLGQVADAAHGSYWQGLSREWPAANRP